MIKFLFRAFGFIIFAAAFIALVADGTKSVAVNAIVMTPLSDSWASLDPASLDKFILLVKGLSTPYIWDPVTMFILGAPTFAVLGILGIILLLLGARRNKRVEKSYYR